MDSILSGRVRAAPQPIHQDQPDSQSPGRLVRWGRHVFRGSTWDPRNPTDNPSCPVCHEQIYEPDGHTKRNPDGSYRGETHVVALNGDRVAIHCDCALRLRDQRLILVPKGTPSPEYVGRWSEYLVTLKLSSLGFQTFTAVESSGHIDILARKDGNSVTIQVRTASWNPETGMFYCTLRVGDGEKWTSMKSDVDFICVVSFRPQANGPDVFVFPSDVLSGKQNVRFTPDGRYAHFRNAWYLVLRKIKGSEAKPKTQKIEFITDYPQSRIGWEKGHIGMVFGDHIEVLLHPDTLRQIGRLYEDDRESDNSQFFWFLVREIDRTVIHEICHMYHDEILGNKHDDEEFTDRISKAVVYGEDYRSFIE